MYVNYVREINSFNRYANDNFVTAAERLLWFGLMDCINVNFANGSIWPGEFVPIPNKRLLSHVPYGEDALMDARNRLKQRGLIEYKPGQKNKTAPQYKIHYFNIEDFSTGYQQAFDSNPENTGNMPGNMPGNVPGNVPGNMPDINLNVNYDVYPDVNPDVDVNTDDDADGVRAIAQERARAKGVVLECFRRLFGRPPTPAEVERIAQAGETWGVTDVLPYALSKTAWSAPRNVLAYVLTILDEYRRHGVSTEDQAARYDYLCDNAEGRRFDISPEKAQKLIKDRAFINPGYLDSLADGEGV